MAEYEVLQFPDEAFPFDDESGREEDVLAWRKLPQNIWFRIVHQQDVKMEQRDVVKILELLQRDGAKRGLPLSLAETLTICRESERSRRKSRIFLQQIYTSNVWVKTRRKAIQRVPTLQLK